MADSLASPGLPTSPSLCVRVCVCVWVGVRAFGTINLVWHDQSVGGCRYSGSIPRCRHEIPSQVNQSVYVKQPKSGILDYTLHILARLNHIRTVEAVN